MSERAREIVDGNRYMTLGTAGADGSPWVSPVWFAPVEYRELLWVSSPSARHSRNIGGRPQVAIVVFDTTAPVGEGQGVYLEAEAEELAGDASAAGIDAYSRHSVATGAQAWTLEAISGPARLRLYRATITAAFLGTRGDERDPISLVD
jgi:uncharacterized protein YhbP (UPF0306 family)